MSVEFVLSDVSFGSLFAVDRFIAIGQSLQLALGPVRPTDILSSGALACPSYTETHSYSDGGALSSHGPAGDEFPVDVSAERPNSDSHGTADR